MKFGTIALVGAASVIISGCATITSSEMQTVSLRTDSAEGQPVEQAKCTLHNDKGSWEMVTPGFVSVHRSSDDLIVECKKDGMADGFLRAISRVAGGMFGNIIFGGGIGALIDHSKGTGYKLSKCAAGEDGRQYDRRQTGREEPERGDGPELGPECPEGELRAY